MYPEFKCGTDCFIKTFDFSNYATFSFKCYFNFPKTYCAFIEHFQHLFPLYVIVHLVASVLKFVSVNIKH